MINDATFSEENIRREHLMQEHDRMHAEDLAELLRRGDEFVTVNCPACTRAGFSVAFVKNHFRFVTCDQCDTLYINPRPPYEMLKKFYENSRYMRFWNEKLFPQTEDERRKLIFGPRARRVVELCREHGANTGTLLDVGAGFGTFCEELGRLKVFGQIFAIEPSHGLAATCRERGLYVIESPVEEVDLAQVDVITNFELIEHLFDPAAFLKACHRLLVPGGLFILTTPNIKGFDLAILKELSANIDGPEHLNYFHPQSLTHLLKRNGFEVLERLTPGKLDAELVRKKILNGELRLAPQDFVKQIIVDEWDRVGDAFQRFLADNCLSSHLWVVARKTEYDEIK